MKIDFVQLIFPSLNHINMSDKITAAAEKLASYELLLPERPAGGAIDEDLIIIREIIIIDTPVSRTIGSQIHGCIGTGEFLYNSVQGKIARSSLKILNEASAGELLAIREGLRTAG
jgi:hypothetical protein